MCADFVVARRCTSPEAKWLVNKIAALRGKAGEIRARILALESREAALHSKIAAMEQVAATVRLPYGADPPVSVRARERYGARGSLTALLQETLNEFYPQGVPTKEFVDRVVAATSFSHDFALRDLNDIRLSVLRRLKHMRAAGKVERVGQIGIPANGIAVWRAVVAQDVSFATLQMQAADAAAQEEKL